MLGPNFRLPRYIKKYQRPSGSTAIHKKKGGSDSKASRVMPEVKEKTLL